MQLRATADLSGEMSVQSAAGAERAPTPTWPGGPKIGRRRLARHVPLVTPIGRRTV
jgi:hypothetical protein